LFRFKQYK